MSDNVEYIVTYIVVTCNDNTSSTASECVMQRKGLQAIVAFDLKVRGVDVITCTLKTVKLCCSEYYNGYHSTPYFKKGNHVLDA